MLNIPGADETLMVIINFVVAIAFLFIVIKIAVWIFGSKK